MVGGNATNNFYIKCQGMSKVKPDRVCLAVISIARFSGLWQTETERAYSVCVSVRIVCA